MRGWWRVCVSVSWCVCGTRARTGLRQQEVRTHLRHETNCINCEHRHIISVDEDFNKLKVDPELNNHVSAILHRLNTFKTPVHPRIRIFHELLKVGMSEHAHMSADSLYVPDKYNVRVVATSDAPTPAPAPARAAAAATNRS